jgi:hypothetical protein
LRIPDCTENGLVENRTQNTIRQKDDRSENDCGEERENKGLCERISAVEGTDCWEPIGKVVPKFPVSDDNRQHRHDRTLPVTSLQVLTGPRGPVAGIVLFAEEPQAALPKRSGMKIYRYKSTDAEGTRDTLDGNPLSVEGHAYVQISEAVRITAKIIESVRVNTPEGLESVKYPITALHEIITNAVLHRDYSVADDIHIRIFDNRVEVASPGTLPAHITPENILNERFARNATIVRLINKFPDPPNKDVGEGLNTAFSAMREMKLKPPTIEQAGGYVKVILTHESLATPEEIIVKYLQDNDQITNRAPRLWHDSNGRHRRSKTRGHPYGSPRHQNHDVLQPSAQGTGRAYSRSPEHPQVYDTITTQCHS